MSVCTCFFIGPLPFEGIVVTMDSHQMNGTQRVVFDRVLTESECKDLLRLTKVRPESCRSSCVCTFLLSRQSCCVPKGERWQHSVCHLYPVPGSRRSRRWLPGKTITSHPT